MSLGASEGAGSRRACAALQVGASRCAAASVRAFRVRVDARSVACAARRALQIARLAAVAAGRRLGQRRCGIRAKGAGQLTRLGLGGGADACSPVGPLIAASRHAAEHHERITWARALGERALASPRVASTAGIAAAAPFDIQTGSRS